VEKWLLNYARNANKPIPVESAITMIKLNAPRRWPLMRLPNHGTSHQKKRKIEGRYNPEQPERLRVTAVLAAAGKFVQPST
jgi:hypothetical protein